MDARRAAEVVARHRSRSGRGLETGAELTLSEDAGDDGTFTGAGVVIEVAEAAEFVEQPGGIGRRPSLGIDLEGGHPASVESRLHLGLEIGAVQFAGNGRNLR